MNPKEAKEYIKGKIVKSIEFEAPEGLRSGEEILSIIFTDGTRLGLAGGYNGEVYGAIIYCDGIADSINEDPPDSPTSDTLPSIPPPANSP